MIHFQNLIENYGSSLQKNALIHKHNMLSIISKGKETQGDL